MNSVKSILDQGHEPLDSRHPHAQLRRAHIPFSADISEADPSAAPDVEIGWHLHPDAWGRGYAAEAATELIAHARHCGHQDLVAVTHPDNHPSQAVARRIGMTSAGLTQRYYDTVCELFTLTL